MSEIFLRIEHPTGPAGARAPAIIKHAVRMFRRLYARNIWPLDGPSVVEPGTTHIMVRAGKRALVLDNTGAYRACLREVDGVRDPHAYSAHYNRTHAMWLGIAAEDRRRGWTRIVRGHIKIAMLDRLILEEHNREF